MPLRRGHFTNVELGALQKYIAFVKISFNISIMLSDEESRQILLKAGFTPQQTEGIITVFKSYLEAHRQELLQDSREIRRLLYELERKIEYFNESESQ